MHHAAPQRPIDYAEETLITAILEGEYPPGSVLPSERDLAATLGVTRPTLREALQRLARDGWLNIHQGKPTVVNDFWWNGGLNVIDGIVRYSRHLPDGFVANLLRVRLDLAPGYTRAAVETAAGRVRDLLAGWNVLEDEAQAYAAFDWRLHRGLTLASGNPVYALILNGFAGLYEAMGVTYFATIAARRISREFYAALSDAARRGDAAAAETIAREVMGESIRLWQAIDGQGAQ